MDKNFIPEEVLVEQGVTTNQQTSNTQNQQLSNPNGLQDVSTEDMTKSLYGLAGAAAPNQSIDPNNPLPQNINNLPADQKAAAEEQQLKTIRDKLHKEQHTRTYFQPTFNRPQPEESVQDRLAKEEEEKQMKEFEDFKKEEKNQPIAVGRAQTKAETNRGASG
jgi:hypothetical protein